MRFAGSRLAACAFALHSVVFAFTATHVEHEKRDLVDEPLVKRERVEGHVELPVRIGLTQRNLALGHEELMAMSDPESPRFGQHYTPEEVEEFFAPSKDTVAAVRSWIEQSIHSHRISISSNKQWIQFDAITSELEDLVKTEFYYYDGGSSGSEISGIGCDRYHVPYEIREHIDYITPGIKLIDLEASPNPSLQRRSSVTSKGRFKPHLKPFSPDESSLENKLKNDCKKSVTPNCIKELYNIHDKPPKPSGNSVGTFNTDQSYYGPKDLAKFLKNYTNIDPDERPTFHGIDGGKLLNETDFSAEANLDLQAVYSMAFPYAKIEYYQVDDPVQERKTFSFNDFLDAIDGSYCHYKAFGIKGNSPKFDPKYPDPSNKKNAYKGKLQCGKFKPTKVISFSYGSGEHYFPMNYQRRQCNEFMKLGMQGTSLIFATGDSGVAAAFNRGTGSCLQGKSKVFGPNAPANCPYITAVGGTTLNGMGKEKGVSFSEGGFSNIYPRPKYQDDAVSKFLKKHTPPYPSYNVTFQPGGKKSGKYNAAGRGYPDVSAIAQRFTIVFGGQLFHISGTSVAAPLFAGIIGRINAHRLAAGKSSLGFLNPTLYKHPEMFNDILKGNNPGCGTKGFECAPGWDPVTGLGSPNYPKMKKILAGLP